MSAERDVRTVQDESEQTYGQAVPNEAEGVRRGGPSVVHSVRLPAEDFADIERLAGEAGVPVGALIRGWVLSGLAAERDTSLADAIDRLIGETERLRRLAARADVA